MGDEKLPPTLPHNLQACTLRPGPAICAHHVEAPAPPSEPGVRALVASGHVARATTAALHLYGAELFGFLAGILEDIPAARDVYAGVGERIRLYLPRFEWGFPLRTWTYAIARRELARYREMVGQRRVGPTSSAKPTFPLPDPMVTQPYRTSAIRSSVGALRSSLAPEDLELLVLRVDRRLTWRDLAITSLGDSASERATARESARLRERYRLIRENLTRSAIRHGMLAPR